MAAAELEFNSKKLLAAQETSMLFFIIMELKLSAVNCGESSIHKE